MLDYMELVGSLDGCAAVAIKCVRNVSSNVSTVLAPLRLEPINDVEMSVGYNQLSAGTYLKIMLEIMRAPQPAQRKPAK